MEEKLKALALRYEDLEAQLADPAVYTDAEKLKRVNQELKELAPVAQAAQAWQRVTQARAEAEALLHDPDFRELAQEEWEQAKAEQERLQEQIRLLLLPKDPNDGRGVIMEDPGRCRR